MVAFLFTSAPMLVPKWFPNPLQTENVDRVKRHATGVVHDYLAASLASPATALAPAAATLHAGK
jgi:hypothetical protein